MSCGVFFCKDLGSSRLFWNRFQYFLSCGTMGIVGAYDHLEKHFICLLDSMVQEECSHFLREGKFHATSEGLCHSPPLPAAVSFTAVFWV